MKKKKTTINYDLVALNPDLTKAVNKNYPVLNMGNRSLLKTTDLEKIGALYTFSKNGKVSRLFKGKRTYPRLNTSIFIKTYTQNHEIVNVAIEISNGIGKVVEQPIKVEEIKLQETKAEQKVIPDMISVYDIFMIDTSKVLKSARDTAISAYIYFVTMFGKLTTIKK